MIKCSSQDLVCGILFLHLWDLHSTSVFWQHGNTAISVKILFMLFAYVLHLQAHFFFQLLEVALLFTRQILFFIGFLLLCNSKISYFQLFHHAFLLTYRDFVECLVHLQSVGHLMLCWVISVNKIGCLDYLSKTSSILFLF